MKEHCGQVTVNELPSKSRLFKFCEKKIDQWLQSHVTQDSGSTSEVPIEFTVSFTEEDDCDQVACMTEIHFGSSVFRGCDLAVDTQQAFMHSLKRLQVAQIAH
ncbi:MAG: hypothetical protein EOP05_07865 [Proteobacteria bacterium]|nr:MAG: hypothetical protein EOP05_07865 [Pseudomonadota bacterium]